jgi:hypothetical protein
MKKQTTSAGGKAKLDPGLRQAFGPDSAKDSTNLPKSVHAGTFKGTNTAFAQGPGKSKKAIDKVESTSIKETVSDSTPAPKKGTVSTKDMIHEKTAPVTFVGASGSGKNQK